MIREDDDLRSQALLTRSFGKLVWADYGSLEEGNANSTKPNKGISAPTSNDGETQQAKNSNPISSLSKLSLASVINNGNFDVVKITVMLLLLGFGVILLFGSHEPHEGDEQRFQAVSSVVPLILPVHLSQDKPRISVLTVIPPVEHTASFTFTIERCVSGETEWRPFTSWTVVSENKEYRQTQLINADDIVSDSARLNLTTDSFTPLAVKVDVHALSEIVDMQVVIGTLILVGVYVVITFNFLHHTLAVLWGSFFALGVLSVVHSRPSFREILTWIDYETVTLLFGMMIIVGLLSETGFFEWTAVKAYKLAKGESWRLLAILAIFMSVMSPFIDSVTTILLFVPMTIRLCKVMDIDPIPVIITEVLYANIAGTATAIGDPPNILIVNGFSDYGVVNFFSFSLHVAPGTVLNCFAVFGLLRFLLRKRLQRLPPQRALKELAIWNFTLSRVRAYDSTDDEVKVVRRKLERHIRELEAQIKSETATTADTPKKEEGIDIDEMEAKYVITDKPLFIKTAVVLGVVVSCFFVEPMLDVDMSLSWIALTGAVALLILADVKDVNLVLEKVELGTLLYFAGLFVMMRALEELGVVEYVANATAAFISTLPEGNMRLGVAVTVLVFTGGTIGGFIDNIPYTQAMIPIVARLANSNLGLPLTPLIWALVFGCCLGGNAALIGAPANIVAAGLAEQQGYKLTFVQFFVVAFPCCLLTLAVSSLYLLVTHVLIPWY